MPTQNPTVISASLDDSKLRDSIKSLVDFVKDKTSEMATSFDENVAKMEAATKRLGNALKGVKTDTKISGTKSESQTIKQVADSYDALAKAKATAMGGGEVKTNWSVLKQYDDQLLQLRQRLIQVREDIDLYRQAIGSGKPTQVSWGQEGLKQAEREAERLMLVITQLESKRGMLVDVLNPGNSFKNYIDNLTKVNPELAALNAQYKQGNTLLGTQVEATQQLATAQSKVTNEVNKQAQALKENEQYLKRFQDAMSMKVNENDIYQVQNKLSALTDVSSLRNFHPNVLSTEQIDALEREINKLVAQYEKLATAEDKEWGAVSRSSRMVRGATSEYKNLTDVIAKNLHISEDSVKQVDLKSSSYNKLNAALKQAQQAYLSLNSVDRESKMGFQLLLYINRLKDAIRGIQSKMNRPLSLKYILGYDESTLENIAYKMRQLASYRSGLDIKKQAGEIKQVSNEIDRLRKKQDDLIGTNNRLTQSNNALSRSWNYMKNRLAFYFTVGASTQFVKNLIDIRSQYEMTERSLGILINSAERGTQIFNELSTMALVSPYTLIELSNAAKQLVAYDVAASDVVDTTRRLADMASAVGVPMERLTYALGQIKAYGYLNSRDNRMFANAGIPLVRQLAEYYSELQGRIISTADVYDMIKKKAVSFNDVMSVINKMTDEGGKFFDFQAKMAGTLKVQLANLTLAWNNMLNDIGKSNQTLISGPIKGLKELFLHWSEINRVLTSMVEAFAAVKIAQIITLSTTTKLTKGLISQRVVGEKLTKTLVGMRSSLAALAANPVTWAFLIVSAVADMTNSIIEAHDAIVAFNSAIRDAGKERFENVSKYLNDNINLYKQLNEIVLSEKKPIQGSPNEYYQDYVKSNISNQEAKKAWEAMQEEIKNTASASDYFISKLNSIDDINDRLRAGFDYLGDIQRVAGAMQEMDNDTIKVSSNYSAWWNLYKAPEGVIENLKDYQKEIDGTATAWDRLVKISGSSNIFSAISYAIDIKGRDLERFRDDLMKTTESIINFASLKGFTPNQEKEFLAKIAEQQVQDANLQPKEALTYRLNLEQQYFEERKKYFDEEIDYEYQRSLLSADANERVEAQQRLQRAKAEKDNFEKTFGQGEVLWDEFTKYMVRNHSYALQQMFGNMTQEEIEHINWSDPKWQKWAQDNAMAFSKQYGVSFDRLRELVNDANRWQIFLKLTISTEGQTEYYNQLTQYDQMVDNAESHIERLQKRVDQLQAKQKKGNITAKETIELNNILLEQQQEEQSRQYGKDRGGLSKKDEKDAKKATADARKRNAAATRAQRQAESELQRSLKEELSIVDKIRNTYKELRKVGVGTTEAIALASSGYEKSVKAINATLAKFGLERFDPSKFAGIENPHELLTMFENQLNGLIASGKAKPAEIVDPETKINEMKIDVKKFDIEKITKGLNSELDKLKDEYELGVELDANPALGDIFAAMMGIPSDMVNELPKDIDDAARLAQTAIKNSLGDAFSNFDVYANVNKDFLKKWFADNAIDAESELAKQITAIIDWLNDIRVKETKKQIDDWDKLLEKYAEVAQKHKKIDEDAAKERETARKQNAPQWIFDAIDTKALRQHADVDFTEFQKSPDWVLATGNLSNLSSKALGLLIQKLEEYKRSATNLDPKQIERINKALRNLRKEMRKNNPFSAISDAIDEGMANAAVFDGRLELLDGQIENLLSNYNNLTKEQRDKLKKLINEYNRLIELQEEASKPSTEKIIGIIGDWAGKIQSVANGIKSIGEAIGSEALTKTADALGDVAGNVQAAAEGYKTWGGWWGAVIGGVTDGLPKIIKWLSGDNGITEKVKDSELEVKKLENAYKSLEHTINKMYGEARYGAEQLAVANKKLQLAELERQLALEKSRKKKNQDESKILDLEGSIIDLKNEINDSINAIANDMLGISSVGDAAENLVSSMIEAFKNGEDWMKSYDETFESMIDNMIMKAIVGKVIGQRIQQIFDYVDSISSSEKQGVADQLAELTRQRERIQSAIATAESKLNSTTIDSAQRSMISKVLEQLRQQENNLNSQIALLTQQYNELGQITPENVDYLRELVSSERDATKRDFEFYADLFGLRFGQNKESANLSALQQGIQGITEDTAGALEAYMNSVSQQVYLHSDLLLQIRDAVVALNGDIQLATNAQMLLQLQQSYQVQMAIQTILVGWSNPSGSAVKVELLN